MKRNTANSWSWQNPEVLARKNTNFMVPSQSWVYCSTLYYPRLLPSHWLPAPPLVQPSPALGDIMGDCLSCGHCQVYLALPICDHHRDSVQGRQWSCGHQVAVRGSWQQLQPRQALLCAERCSGSPRRCLPPFSSSGRIPFTDRPFTVIKERRASYDIWL